MNRGLSGKLKLAKNPPGGFLSNFNKIIFFLLIKKKIILLKLAFPNVVPVEISRVENPKIYDPN